MEWMLMPLRRYADFSGRSRRMEFWMWLVFQFLLYILFIIVVTIFGGAVTAFAGDNPASGLAAVGAGIIVLYGLYLLVWLALIIPSLAVQVRRLHDTDRSGWWVLAPLAANIVMVIGVGVHSQVALFLGGAGSLIFAIMLLVFFFLDGTPGDNRFGPDPKGRGTAEVFA